uniref:Uncharacterized protein n=1 Tax=Oryza sativa subsp. japonica TaxID=39947 RepID=Q69XR5_ORYSJ|nr:hypothetical protein [Oryza sativa Japonica Group]
MVYARFYQEREKILIPQNPPTTAKASMDLPKSIITDEALAKLQREAALSSAQVLGRSEGASSLIYVRCTLGYNLF